MAEEKPKPGKGRRRASLKDITPVLKGWEYEAGTINVRKIVGDDGQPKLQMRLDLGLLQMEITGRPDGRRPHGCESFLDFFEKRVAEYRLKNGTDLGFRLSGSQCQHLREEALMYYHRYLSLFVLGEFAAVARDTSRNLRVLNLCNKYGVSEQDRLIMEQYRPYILMMNYRSMASLQCECGNYRDALQTVKKGLREIRGFFTKFNQEEAYRHCNEARLLRRFGRELQRHLPVDPVRKLQRQLNRAIRDERYEEAARLRDELERLNSSSSKQLQEPQQENGAQG